MCENAAGTMVGLHLERPWLHVRPLPARCHGGRYAYEHERSALPAHAFMRESCPQQQQQHHI
ncbi:hypothetical protein B0H17DRAFT_1097898 [Mycena rosella]|uniref:Uncharacterized protein n=1 Tax=Mycena rosella TaxID=1033263 RepID=A0AAD7CPX7_MYCRO|nr:hypothetical protein B0H17DRAFT_1097898 [Mycena rosella]